MLTIFGAIAQLEREYILGRHPIAVDKEKFEVVYARWKAGECKAVETMRELGLKASTFYRRVWEYEDSKL